ncbi:MAG: hypothetical protein LBL83_12390 [Clostridiales bacterium]|nr:hypothetical protein [Clostridiales bacterium]
MEDKAVIKILGKFEKMEERFDRIDARLDGIDWRLGGIDGRLNMLEKGQVRLEKRFNRLEGTVDAIAEQTARLTEFETETRMRLDKLEAARPA